MCSHALWYISSLHALNKIDLFFLTYIIKLSITNLDKTIDFGPFEKPW
jgi:hypothetical protein